MLASCDIEEDECGCIEEGEEETSIVLSDIPLFWSVFDSSEGNYTPSKFENDYFKGGSKVLEHYFEQKVKDAAMLSDLMNREDYLAYYTSIRESTESLEGTTADIRTALSDFKGLYPNAISGDIYLFMGPFASGGSVLENGDIAIGVEFFVQSPEAKTEGLPEYIKDVLKGKEYIPTVVIHELVHVQQREYARKIGLDMESRSLLEMTIAEGVAEFLAYHSTQQFLTDHLSSYVESNESLLRESFMADMHHSDYSKWLYNTGSSGDIPPDLGYYIGFEIAQKHFETFGSVERLLQITDAEAFLEESEYFQE
ncbi:MAG: hypothetical protein Tsb004_28130 [Allomuricauda sp.]